MASPRISILLPVYDAAPWLDDRICVEERPHEGIVTALNAAAVARARGDLLVRLDADDVSTPDRLERLQAFADAHPDVDWLPSRVQYVPPEDVGPGMRRYEEWVNGLLTHAEIRRDRFVECPLPHPTWAIRRRAFLALGGYRAGGFPEDHELFLRAREGPEGRCPSSAQAGGASGKGGRCWAMVFPSGATST